MTCIMRENNSHATEHVISRDPVKPCPVCGSVERTCRRTDGRSRPPHHLRESSAWRTSFAWWPEVDVSAALSRRVHALAAAARVPVSILFDYMVRQVLRGHGQPDRGPHFASDAMVARINHALGGDSR